VDQRLAGGVPQWGIGRQVGIWHPDLVHLGLTVRELHTDLDQGHEVWRINSAPMLLGANASLRPTTT